MSKTKPELEAENAALREVIGAMNAALDVPLAADPYDVRECALLRGRAAYIRGLTGTIADGEVSASIVVRAMADIEQVCPVTYPVHGEDTGNRL